MAQNIFIEHGVDLESFKENQRWLGIFEPGIYRGFDQGSFSGNTLTINHSLTGIRKTNITADGQSAHTAIVLSKQGSLIHEDASIALNVDYNLTNDEARIDYVIGTHEYQDAPDSGLNMVFAIIKGPLDNPIEPTLDTPLNQILIGKIYIPANAANHDESIYIREKRPGLANSDLTLKSNNQSISIESINEDINIETRVIELNEEFTDFNSLGNEGIYKTLIDEAPENSPVSYAPFMALIKVIKFDADNSLQILTLNSFEQYIRVKTSSGWGAWDLINGPKITSIENGVNENTQSIKGIAKDSLALSSGSSTEIATAECPAEFAGSDSIRWYRMTVPKNLRRRDITSRAAAGSVDLIARLQLSTVFDMYPGYKVIVFLNKDTNFARVGVVGKPTAALGTTGASFETSSGACNIIIPEELWEDGNTPFTGGGVYRIANQNVPSMEGLYMIFECVDVTPLTWLLTKFSIITDATT